MTGSRTQMQIDVCGKCRQIRLVMMALLIVFAALAGYHWGSILESGGFRVQDHDIIILALVFTAMAAVIALAVEATVTKIEMAAAVAQRDEEKQAEESSIEKEHARELDRIVDKLSEDNSDLRYRLLSKKMHEMGEDMVRTARGDAAHQHAWRSKAF